jgi:hypothetical protein
MYKNCFFLTIVLTGLTLVSGCSQDEQVGSTTLSVSPQSIQADADSKTYQIRVTSDWPWTAESSADWCTVFPVSAEGNDIIAVTISSNTGTEPRTATITVTSDVFKNILDKVTVTQKAAAATGSTKLLVSTSKIEAQADSASYQITVKSDSAWTATVSDSSWVTVYPASGSGSEAVFVTVTVKTIMSDTITEEWQRTSQITFASGNAVATVDVEQKVPTEAVYYSNGEVIKLLTHTKGNGIRVIIIGDGFDKNDCRRHGGFYYDMCTNLTKLFLTMPIIRDFTEYFDVWARVDISRERGVRNCEGAPSKCIDNVYGAGPDDPNWSKINANARTAAEGKKHSIIFMSNGNAGGYAYGDIGSYPAHERDNAYWMIHEFTGHVIGYFPDLYPAEYEKDTLNDEVRKTIDESHARGELCMLDYRTDPAEVFWKDFIGKPGYENVGLYPTGHYSVKQGELVTCEPPLTSAMYDRNMYFTVMERYQLWRQIQMRAQTGVETTMEEFMKYDVKHINREGGNSGAPLWDEFTYIEEYFEIDPRVFGFYELINGY